METNTIDMLDGRDEDLLPASSNDRYVTRARPTIVYSGLVFIFLVYVLPNVAAVLLGKVANEPAQLPDLFWYAWGGVSGTWVVSRSAERILKGNTRV